VCRGNACLSGEEYDTKTGYMALAREDGPSALQKKKRLKLVNLELEYLFALVEYGIRDRQSRNDLQFFVLRVSNSTWNVLHILHLFQRIMNNILTKQAFFGVQSLI
jgi:hypothetical protein